MFKRFIVALCALAVVSTAGAQEASSQAELERRVKELETRVAQLQKSSASPDLDEIRREIDVLTREIENLKTGEKKVAQADVAQYGLGAAASKVYRADLGVSFGGYGEFVYRNVENATPTADLLRAVLYTGYKFNDRALFNSELEVEHASTERGGAVSMEFAYLDYLMRPQANLRGGLLLMPVGIINEQHEPTAYLASTRPLTERIIVPSTWSELGAGVFGDAGRLSYRAYVTNGLSNVEVGGEEGLHETPQKGAEANASRGAIVGRLDFHPVEGTVVGASYYRGGIADAGSVALSEVHVDSRFRGLQLRGLVARGSAGRGVVGLNPEDPIGRTFGGWYAEAGYDIAPLLGLGQFSLTPYARHEHVDTQRTLPTGFAADGANDRTISTLGVGFKPIAQSVIKMDWQRNRTRAGDRTNQFNVALGYIF